MSEKSWAWRRDVFFGSALLLLSLCVLVDPAVAAFAEARPAL